MGVTFTDAAQYISVPSFTVNGLASNTPTSFSVSAWVKLSSTPGADAFVFRFASDDVNNYFALFYPQSFHDSFQQCISQSELTMFLA